MARTPVAEGAKVSAKRVKARTVYTFHEKDKVWSRGGSFFEWDKDFEVSGSIVRLKPPEGVVERVVEELKATLLKAGAAAVRTMPRRRSAVVPAKAEFQPLRKPREVVMEMAEQANVDDRAALKVALEEALGAAGV